MSPTTWKRILWQRQPYPDNYIPADSFLASLRRNPNFTPYTYWPLVLSCCPITQHLGTIFIFVAVFVRLQKRSLDARVLLWISVACFLVGYLVWEVLDYSAPSRGPLTRFRALKSSLLFFLTLMGLAPVLRTLTAATSSDSIWALSACQLLLNALLADYGCENSGSQSQERLSSVLSMNAAISSSVVLASRLPDDLSVFSLVLFAVHLFALFPMLRHRFGAVPPILQVTLTVSISALSFALTMSLSPFVTALTFGIYVTVNVVAPAILVWAQRYKNEIRGPWDVAVPRVNGDEIVFDKRPGVYNTLSGT
ncbi:phosphatidylinositol N-acetylglucosaminyltransferase [Pisolithus sp. B1]|nr:phosphatidylinositol N-acetylglucosaminyltransferase [Pisolithus croceorrhizus]KAI6136653.1 phosphatidylinositol N-acetylglucosaminyltransferase [Pisolithus sp. B1]